MLWDTRTGQALSVLFEQEEPVPCLLSFPTPAHLLGVGKDEGGNLDLTMPIVALKRFPNATENAGSCLVHSMSGGGLEEPEDCVAPRDVAGSKPLRKGQGEKPQSLADQVQALTHERERLLAANEILYQALLERDI